MVDGAEAVPAGPDASLNVPIGTVGGLYQLQLRVEIAAPAGLWSRWQTIASGTVLGAPQLSAVSAAPVGGTGYSGHGHHRYRRGHALLDGLDRVGTPPADGRR
jgi:hypothetical protein